MEGRGGACRGAGTTSLGGFDFTPILEFCVRCSSALTAARGVSLGPAPETGNVCGLPVFWRVLCLSVLAHFWPRVEGSLREE